MGPRAILLREPWFRPANWFWQWFLTRYDFAAIPMPWGCVHVRRDMFAREGVMPILREHERVHYEQMEREGPWILGILWWHLKYFLFLVKHGYRKNPYEIEAYTRFGWQHIRGPQ
jgi:hypothetical protein